jgi:antitoxin component of MazEF toxin-antitoxin module
MVRAKIQKHGDEFVVTIPQEEMERLGLREGDEVSFQPARLESGHVLRPEVQAAADESWKQNEPAYRYLADR